MDWRIKVVGHWAVSIVPNLGYAMQRHITHTLPLSDESFADHVGAAERHVALATRHLGRLPLSAYEFGAGWDLVVPMTLSRSIPSQTVTDVRRLVRRELVADTALRLGVDVDPTVLGIRYLAPIDTKDTKLDTGSFDLVHSTDTLEHVPLRDLVPLLAECRRLLRQGGVLTARVDYTDHYSHADPSLDPFHFRMYSERVWRVLNPPSHFQSRLRHPELLDAFDNAGFDVQEVDLGILASDISYAWVIATPRPLSR